MVDDSSLLSDLGSFYESIPFEYLLIGHCVLVASWFPTLKDRFLLSYWVGLLAAFGGGLITAVILNQPIPLFASNTLGITWTVCWWLANYAPGNIVSGALKWTVCRIPAKACLNTLRAGLIASRVDLIWQMYPGVIAGPLVIGSIAGTGGRFAIDPILGGFGHLEGAAEIAQPGFAARSGFLGSLLYWLTVHQYPTLSPLEGKALIVSLFIVHGVLVDLFGWHFDFTHPLAYMAHTVANVPMPGCSKGKLPTLPAKSGTATSKADSSKRASEIRKETKKGR